jgi:outer membrane protein assembly factor BamB
MTYPNWVSPLVTNGIIFTGTVTDAGKNYSYNAFGAVTKSPLVPTGILMALDADTGNLLWQYNVGAPITLGGPSIGNGMLLVGTGEPNEVGSNPGGYLVAFGLPSGNSTGLTENQLMSAMAGQVNSSVKG